MSTTNGVQNLLVNVFRPVYTYSSDTGFVPKLELASVGYSGNTISVFTAAVGDSADNVYVGSNAGNSYLDIRACSSNTVLGYGAGSLMSNVSNSVYIGAGAGAPAFDASNVIGIGQGAGGNGISNVFIGTGTKSMGRNNILLGHGIDSGSSNYVLRIGSTIYGDMSKNWVGIGLPTPSTSTSNIRFDVSGDAKITGILSAGAFDVSSGAIASSNLVVTGYIRNNVTPSQFDISGGNISNSATSTSSNFIGTSSASNSIGGVTLSNTDVTLAGTITGSTADRNNSIGGVTLSNNSVVASTIRDARIPSQFDISGGNISNSGVTTSLRFIGTSNTSNSIGGTTLSNGNVTIPGILSAAAFDTSAIASSNLVVPGYLRNAVIPTQFDISAGNISNLLVHTAGTFTTSSATTSNVIGGVTLSNSIAVVPTIRNATVPTQFDISGGNISNSAVHTAGTFTTSSATTSNVIGGVTLSNSNISNSGTTTTSNVRVTGNVGIGTSTPTYVLDLSAGNTDLVMRVQAITWPSIVFSGTTDTSSGQILYDAGAANNQFMLRTSVGTPLAFQVGGAYERMRIAPNGNVGIGDRNPSALLDISSGTTLPLGINRTVAGNNNALLLRNSSVARWGIAFMNADTGSGNGGSDFGLNSYTDTGSLIGQPFVVKRSNGNVGIGTTAPTFLLDVSGSSSGGQAVFRNQATNGQAAIAIIGNNGTDSSGIYLVHNASLQGFYSMNTLPFTIANGNNSRRMTILGTNGNVGIGTTDPSQALTVVGNIVMGTGLTSADYRQFILGGGNSYGYIYGAWAKYSEGIHIGFNFFNNNTTNVIQNPSLATSRISTGDGYIGLYTGGVNQEPTKLGYHQTSAGNVGIGTTGPAAALDVSGAIRSTAATSNYIGGVTLSNQDITLLGRINATSTSASNSIGAVTLSNGAVRGGNGAVGAPTYSFTNETNTGLYLGATGSMSFAVGGAGRMTISNSNVGIGTFTPYALLDVNGTARVGNPSNTTSTALLEIGGGAAYNGTGGTTAIAIQSYTGGGGFRHFIRSRHTSTVTNSGNAFDFFTNNSGTATGSSTPGTGNVLAMSVTSAGVGIGKFDPATGYRLDVSGPTLLDNTISIANNASLPGNTGSQLWIAGGYASPTVGRFVFGDGSGWYLRFANRSSSTTRDVVSIRDTGLVGIGTTEPTVSLDISSSTQSDGVYVKAPNANVTVKDPGNTYPLQMYSSTAGQGLYTGNAKITISTNGLAGNFGLTNSNNLIGIGTSNPNYALDVVSSATTSASINMTTWPRYGVSTTHMSRGTTSVVGACVIFPAPSITLDANLGTVTNDATYGTYFVCKRTGLWTITACYSGTYVNSVLGMDVCGTIVGTSFPQNVSITPIAITTGNYGGFYSYSGYLPSNTNLFYKFKSNNPGNSAGANLSIVFHHELPTAAGSWPYL